MKALASLLPLLLATASVAADLPDLVLPQGVGVNIHFTRGHEPDLDLIAAAGFKVIRMDFSWGGTERKKGEYDWGAYDELTANLEKRGLRAIYILDYSNGLWEDTIVSRNPISGREQRDTASPRQPESIAAFARWAAAAAAHFKGRRIIWEIWNEPNIGFWKPAPNVTNYTELVLATCQAVRAADPQATIIAPASSGFPWPFFEYLFKSGALASLDAVSVHPYRSYSRGPETAHEDYRRLRGLIERHAPPERKFMPIISGEWGYATHARGGVTLETQAAFIARQQLANLYHQVPLSIWYDWKNDGTDTNYNEHNFGTVTPDLKPKPSYAAVQTLTRQLSGYRIARRLEAGHDDAWVLLCVNGDGQQKLAAWTTGQPRESMITLKGIKPDDVAAVDSGGGPIAMDAGNDRLRLALKPGPQYVTFRKPFPEFTAAAAWRVGPPVRSLLTAGEENGLAVRVSARNPFEQRAIVRFRLQGVPGAVQETEKPLQPGESLVHPFNATIHQRWPEEFAGGVETEFLLADRGDRFVTLGRWTEPLDFVVVNPLRLSLAPIESGLRVEMVNPARDRFLGLLRVGATDQPVALTAERPDATIDLVGESSPARVELRDLANHVAVRLDGVTFRPLELASLKALLDGDAKVPARASLVLTNSPPEGRPPFAKAFRLDYAFEDGWRFVRCAPVDEAGHSRVVPFPRRPAALGLWVCGDGSKNALRMRFTDSNGQTFQPNGPGLDWTGWRWVTFDLSDLRQAGHWGGPDDGVPRGDRRLDCPLLVDGARHKTGGTIYFAGLTWIFP